MRFVLEGQPVPKARPRVGSHGTYTPAKTLAAENEWRFLFARQQVQPYSGPVRVQMWFYLKDARRVDLDNLVKLVQDAGNPTDPRLEDGYLWRDDTLVEELHAFKYIDRANPRTELEVTPL